MEFSRRGPDTGGAGDGHRFPDPPAHGEREPMLVTRDALLSQLHMACLRKEIIEAELAKIERAMALCAAKCVEGDKNVMPKNIMTQEARSHGIDGSKPCPFSIEQPMAQQNAQFDEPILPGSNKAVPPSKTSPAETWKLTGITILVKKPNPSIKWNCTVCQVQATSEQNLQQHYAGQKHLENVATLDPTAKGSDQKAKAAAEPSLITEKKKTSSIKWSCCTCQANGTSQSTLEAHLKGRRHQQNIAATCVEGDKNVMPFLSAPEPSLCTKEKKPSLIKWSCSTCQANGTSQSTLEAHLKGRRHQQNIAATCVEGVKNVMPFLSAPEPSLCTKEKKPSLIKWSCSTCQPNGTSQSTLEAHLKGRRHQQNITATCVEGDKNVMPFLSAPEPSLCTKERKPSLIKWSCSTCQANCTSQSTLEAHLKGRRHQQNIAATNIEGDNNGMTKNVAAQEGKVQSLLEESKNKASDSESQKAKLIPDSRWICNICHAHCTCESDLENHLAGKRHQLNIQVLREKIKEEKNNLQQIAKNQKPSPGWNCAMCEAKCNSESQFEAHCRSSRHQQKIQAILGKGKIAEGSSSRTANELHSHGPNSKNASSEMAENQPALYLLFESCTTLVHHRVGKKHRAKLSARNESS